MKCRQVSMAVSATEGTEGADMSSMQPYANTKKKFAAQKRECSVPFDSNLKRDMSFEVLLDAV